MPHTFQKGIWSISLWLSTHFIMGAHALSKAEKEQISLANKNDPEHNEKRRMSYKKQNEKRKKKDVFLLPEPDSSKDSTSNELMNIQFPQAIQTKGPELHKDETSYAADFDKNEGAIYDLRTQKGQNIN